MCGVCMRVCICVLYVGGGEGGAWVHMTKCGIGGWASGWGGRQTDRQRQRETDTQKERMWAGRITLCSRSLV